MSILVTVNITQSVSCSFMGHMIWRKCTITRPKHWTQNQVHLWPGMAPGIWSSSTDVKSLGISHVQWKSIFNVTQFNTHLTDPNSITCAKFPLFKNFLNLVYKSSAPQWNLKQMHTQCNAFYRSIHTCWNLCFITIALYTSQWNWIHFCILMHTHSGVTQRMYKIFLNPM